MSSNLFQPLRPINTSPSFSSNPIFYSPANSRMIIYAVDPIKRTTRRGKQRDKRQWYKTAFGEREGKTHERGRQQSTGWKWGNHWQWCLRRSSWHSHSWYCILRERAQKGDNEGMCLQNNGDQQRLKSDMDQHKHLTNRCENQINYPHSTAPKPTTHYTKINLATSRKDKGAKRTSCGIHDNNPPVPLPDPPFCPL